MAIGVFHRVSTLVSVCTKQVSHVSKKLRNQGSTSKKFISRRTPQLTRRLSFIPFLGKKKDGELDDEKDSTSEEEEEEEEEEEALWRRTVLMGEKCQPLDFPGVIYYDTSGNQIPELPPRSPLRSPFCSFSFPAVVSPEKGC